MADWAWEVVRSFVGAGVGTAVVTGGLALWRERSKKRGEATYLALRLAVTLEAFAGACSDLIAKNANAETPPGYPYPMWQFALPLLADYPSDGDGWKSIETDLSAAALNLRNEVVASQASLSFTTADADHNIEWEVRREALQLGLSAHNIAKQMREAYGLPNVPSSSAYADKLDAERVRFDEEAEEKRIYSEKFRAAHQAANR